MGVVRHRTQDLLATACLVWTCVVLSRHGVPHGVVDAPWPSPWSLGRRLLSLFPSSRRCCRGEHGTHERRTCPSRVMIKYGLLLTTILGSMAQGEWEGIRLEGRLEGKRGGETSKQRGTWIILNSLQAVDKWIYRSEAPVSGARSWGGDRGPRSPCAASAWRHADGPPSGLSAEAGPPASGGQQRETPHATHQSGASRPDRQPRGESLVIHAAPTDSPQPGLPADTQAVRAVHQPLVLGMRSAWMAAPSKNRAPGSAARSSHAAW